MSNDYIPNGYYTTGTLQTSVADEEVLEQGANSTRDYRNISLYNVHALTIVFVDKKDNEYELYIPATVGFSIDVNNLPIISLKIKEDSKSFTLFASY